MDADIAPGVHRDVWAWDPADPILGAPPAGFVPTYDSGGNCLSGAESRRRSSPRAPSPSSSSTHRSRRCAIRTACWGWSTGPAPAIRSWWSSSTKTYTGAQRPATWPPIRTRGCRPTSPRARRGAKVRVLLDAFFDNQDLNSPRSNLRTVEYLTAVAQAEGLDLQARRRNPTGQGIHNKMVLAQIGGQGWAIVGSLNGGEVSAKLNREMALLVGSDEAYTLPGGRVLVRLGCDAVSVRLDEQHGDTESMSYSVSGWVAPALRRGPPGAVPEPPAARRWQRWRPPSRARFPSVPGPS